MIGLLAQAVSPSPDLIAPLASFGGLGIAVWFMWIQLGKAEERTKAAEERAERASADAVAVRDSHIRDVLPIMATTIEHDKQLMAAAERLVEVAQHLALGFGKQT